MSFTTHQECEELYREFAVRKGFDTKSQSRKTSGVKGDTSGIFYYLVYQCRKEGFKDGNNIKPCVEMSASKVDVEPKQHKARTHPDGKVGCDAIIHF